MIVVAALAVAACGEQALAPVDVAADCPAPLAQVTPVGESLLVDDFEDDDDRLALPSPGRWASSDDGTSRDVTMQIGGRCAATGRRALRFRATAVSGWGAVVAGWLRRGTNNAPLDFDASAYDALSFHAAVTRGSRDTPMRASVATVDSNPAWGICTECYDSYGSIVTLTPTWQRFVVPIDDMLQWGWGVPQVRPPRRDRLIEVLLYLYGTFDVWIDDVRFVRTR